VQSVALLAVPTVALLVDLTAVQLALQMAVPSVVQKVALKVAPMAA
jgi:hypothetical protein